jgi:ABC-type multidrug transport system fused ATPase/permease subunit
MESLMPYRILLAWRNSILVRSSRVLPGKDRFKILAVTLIQIFLSILDLAGVALVGVLGALAITGVESQKPGGRISSLLQMLGIHDKPLQTQATIIGLTAAILLITRSLLSVYFIRKTMFFLSRRAANLSSLLISRLLTRSILEIQSRTTQETIYTLTQGVNTVTLGVMGITISLISDSALMVVMATGLFLIDPVIAISTFVVFAAIALLLYRLLHLRVRKLGMRDTELSIRSSEKIMEVLLSYRESVVRNRRHYYANEIGRLRLAQANANAEMSFIPSISKYIIETTVIVGALAVGYTQFAFQDATHAVATLSVFLAAGTRIAPAVLRMQQGTLQLKGALGSANPTLALIESLANVTVTEDLNDSLQLDHAGFYGEVVIDSISLTYPGSILPAVSNVSLKINVGDSVAFVGASGAGKTSIIDCILGVLRPDSGSITISGMVPLDAIRSWPGAISYVPQDVSIVNGTIKHNVGLGYPEDQVTDELVWHALEKAHISEFIRSLPNQLLTEVGERGAKLSGGQRQRIGIARALFTNPQLLVLDEATSALDGETEVGITDSIGALKGEVTVILIAHRLSTVRDVDTVVYMENGVLVKAGSFDGVRSSVPQFDKQARIMGL